tara:strand:- start:121 stop:1134 length:1014 start_codon:yes stop_codon:yes gene_type:complete
MTILITGCAGFVGYHVSKLLLETNYDVIGLDNLNDYYDINLKKSRLKNLKNHKKNFIFYKIDLCDYSKLNTIFKRHNPKKIINLAAQAGVRYSLINPKSYIDSNLLGFFNLIELSKNYKVKNFVYASSSSIYGANTSLPFKENTIADHPIQLYAATKRSNELIAHAYSSIHKLPTVGLRFFTAYGPWGRPDQALFLFTKNIIQNRPINLFNYGDHSRDFTYISDIANAILLALKKAPRKNQKWNSKKPDPSSSKYPFKIYNIGANKTIRLMEYIKIIEKYLNKKAKIKFRPLQKGDVKHVSSSINKIKKELGYKPKISVDEGVKRFVDWYKNYYKYK